LGVYGRERLLVVDQIPCFVDEFRANTWLTSTAVLSLRGVVDCQVSVPNDLMGNLWVGDNERITVTRSGAATAEVMRIVIGRSEGQQLWILGGAHVNTGAESMRELAERQSTAFVTESDAGELTNPWEELGHPLRDAVEARGAPCSVREAALRLLDVTMAFGVRGNDVVTGAFARCGLLEGHEDDPLHAGLIGAGAPPHSPARIMNCAEIIANLTRRFDGPRRRAFRESGAWTAESQRAADRVRLGKEGTLRVLEEVEAGDYPWGVG
jgi:hypothetical protein